MSKQRIPNVFCTDGHAHVAELYQQHFDIDDPKYSASMSWLARARISVWDPTKRYAVKVSGDLRKCLTIERHPFLIFRANPDYQNAHLMPPGVPLSSLNPDVIYDWKYYCKHFDRPALPLYWPVSYQADFSVNDLTGVIFHRDTHGRRRTTTVPTDSTPYIWVTADKDWDFDTTEFRCVF